MEPTAYFSAEIGFSRHIPTYSGGLGILAGDHMKAAADLELPIFGVTLLYRQGYFRQHIGPDGWQEESYPVFNPDPLLEKLDQKVEIKLYGRRLRIAMWRKDIIGYTGTRNPIIFLDTDVADNNPEDRSITHRLYGGDQELRLMQEAVLGFGGVEAIKRLFPQVTHFHLNEGHTSFAPLALLNSGVPFEEVRKRCHFTTHTPVPAGHDVFHYDMAHYVLGELLPDNIRDLAGHDSLSMTELALNLCGTANGVSKLHGEVTRKMFPGRTIGHVTNGVHHHSWVARPMGELYDRELPGWRSDPRALTRVPDLDDSAMLSARRRCKRELLSYANSDTGLGYAEPLLTIGFARRAAAYKRASLLFRDVDRLRRICGGRVQFIFAGKAHPRDEAGHRLIQAVVGAAQKVADSVRTGYLDNYTMWTGRLVTSGVDVWLNTPIRPHEASGTSGMKAALNGVPSASISDGWWAEGAKDGINGWVLGDPTAEADDEADAEALYDTLENKIIPTYYDDPAKWISIVKQAVATGTEFTAARMVGDYLRNYYDPR